MPTYCKNSTAAQLSFKAVNGWGGKRRRAGRPSRSGMVNHLKREAVDLKKPLHVTMKVRDPKINLRYDDVLAEFERCAARARLFGLRILHFSLLKDHIHLIVEAASNSDLSSGMRSFGAAFGKVLRKIFGGAGKVFVGRYHLRVLSSPSEVRHAFAYVFQNFSKHSKLIAHLDRYSSAPYFGLWKSLLGGRRGPLLQSEAKVFRPPFLSAPTSWLARVGWHRSRA